MLKGIMLNVTYKPFMLSAVMLSVVLLNVVMLLWHQDRTYGLVFRRPNTP